jgi:photosystem II stability/assembly factor-like uncharacterized protein
MIQRRRMHHFAGGGSVARRLSNALLAAIIAAVTMEIAPLEAQSWTNVTGNLAYKLSECGNLTLVSAVPDSKAVIAGVAARGLWVNTSGTTWSRLSDVEESDRITNRPSWVVYDPANPAIYWESGTYNGPGIYKTTNGGKTFERLGNLTHNDYISIDFTDPERHVLLAGGHEQGQTIYASFDGGKTWRNIGRSLPTGSGASTHPFALDSRTFLVNVATPMGSPLVGIYRSKDGGETWDRVSTQGPPGPLLRTAGGALFWATDGRLMRSTNLGATWAAINIDGLRPTRPVELPGGQLVAVGQSTLLMSSDAGATWAPLGGPLPYPPDGLAYSAQREAFFIWRGDCRQLVPANAVMQLDLEVPAAPAKTRSY